MDIDDEALAKAGGWFSFGLGVVALTLLLRYATFPIYPFDFYSVAAYTSFALFLLMGWLFGVVLWLSENRAVDVKFFDSENTVLKSKNVWQLCAVYTFIISIGVFGTVAYQGLPVFPASLILLLVFVPSLALFFFVFVDIIQVELRTALLVNLKDALLIKTDSGTIVFASVLTSLGVGLNRLEGVFCFFVTGTFTSLSSQKGRDLVCGYDSMNWLVASPILCSLPFFIRFFQCISLVLKDEERYRNGIRACQYVITIAMITVAGFSLSFEHHRILFAHWTIRDIIWVSIAAVHVIFSSITDFIFDWNQASHLEFSRYFLFAVNLVAHGTYAIALSPQHLKSYLVFQFCILELVRRTVWLHFYVLAKENEGITLETTPLVREKREEWV